MNLGSDFWTILLLESLWHTLHVDLDHCCQFWHNHLCTIQWLDPMNKLPVDHCRCSFVAIFDCPKNFFGPYYIKKFFSLIEMVLILYNTYHALVKAVRQIRTKNLKAFILISLLPNWVEIWLINRIYVDVLLYKSKWRLPSVVVSYTSEVRYRYSQCFEMIMIISGFFEVQTTIGLYFNDMNFWTACEEQYFKDLNSD